MHSAFDPERAIHSIYYELKANNNYYILFIFIFIFYNTLSGICK